MLKPYNELSRWYGALEPDASTPPPRQAGARETDSRQTDAREGDVPEADAHESRAHESDARESDPRVTDIRTGRRTKDDVSPDAGTGIRSTRSGAPDAPAVSGPASYPDHLGEEDDLEQARARAEVPTDLPARRSEFVGGWSDWVAADHAPGPDDDYEPRPIGSVRFPWPEDDVVASDERPHSGTKPALRTAARAHPTTRRARVLLMLALAALLLVAAVLGALWLLGPGQRGAAAPRPMQFTAGSVQSDAAADCPTERSVGVLRGATDGGTESGPDAVLAFQYAYYVERSGEQARAVVAPDAPISPAAVIQRGIDTIPVGTSHCVRVITITENRYSVEVTEYRPGGVPATYNRQTVTTAVVGGRTLITGIAAG
ncbi:hypothetical protein [Nocardia bovistercoris]|uniref:DUF8176 domain-containing protein n=1 Tax=Nocardia bovistercoris TaxID=2785916 RepID=A0A931I6V5_9NOCA|nr:hypothetical protein [Nocardia bovistercoris]MBH0774960.1 hypothetical protein [Nocardia bovistercoris]